MSVGEQRAPIGITAIWGESEGIERVSLWAVTAHCARQALENVRRSPITHILTIVTISVAIFLLGIFSLFISNSSRAVSGETGEMVVMIFLSDSASRLDVDAMSGQLRQIAPGLYGHFETLWEMTPEFSMGSTLTIHYQRQSM
jgi:hypothetical protein